jgi:hypothetical protein
MESKDAALLAIMAIVFGVPAIGISVRMALKPIVDSIIRLRESTGAVNDGAVERRVLQLQDEVAQLRASVSDLEETVSFQQKLLAAPPANPAVSASAAER